MESAGGGSADRAAEGRGGEGAPPSTESRTAAARTVNREASASNQTRTFQKKVTKWGKEKGKGNSNNNSTGGKDSPSHGNPVARKGVSSVLILVGLPGSGKSTFAQKLRSKGWWIISQDALGSRESCLREFRKALQRGKNVAVDRCNHTRAQREVWIREALSLTSSSERTKIYALCFNTDVRECRRRVMTRPGHATLSPQEEEEKNVVFRFLRESEEVKNREGFIKIYRRYSKKEEEKGDEGRLLQIILRETSGKQEEGSANKGVIDCSKSVLLLFDLNGTLINKTGRHRTIKSRPSLGMLLKLREFGFTLGIYSSATLKTCTKALKQMVEDMRANGQSKEDELGVVFRHLLYRDFCELAPGVMGKPWDTVKPLGKYVSDINKCILFDDDEHKVLEGEKFHHVLVPAWDGDEEDDMLECLVESTLRHIESSNESDVRMAAAKVSLDLVEHAESKMGGTGGEASPTSATGLADLTLEAP
ncbi:FCP1 homology domain-containing protein [Chloropicon primus]|nr:FCP1 homology domain-containing protein [Chloropicon primus]